MSFEAPVLLVFLLAVPAAVAGYVWLEQHRAERAAAWTSPALAPNLVLPRPGLAPARPVAVLLVGVTLLLVGFARPKATITVKRHEATVVLVVDVSGSMAAQGRARRAGSPRRAQRAARLVATVPKTYRIAVVTFSDHAALLAPPTRDRAIVLAALKRAKAGPQGTALTAAVSRAVTVATSVSGSGAAGQPAGRRARVLGRRPDRARADERSRSGSRRRRRMSRSPPIAVGTANGVVHQKIAGGYTEQIAVPVESTTLRTIALASGGHVETTIDDGFLRRTVAAARRQGRATSGRGSR